MRDLSQLNLKDTSEQKVQTSIRETMKLAFK